MTPNTQQPQGRSMKELRRIIAAEDARRDDLLEAFGNLTEAEQFALVRYAQGLVKEGDAS
jgi:hypothetical protein